MTRRRALGGVAAAVAVSAGALLGIPAASAHVHVSSAGAVRNSVALVTFEVPNESRTGSATTQLTVTLPDVGSARAEATPGWTATMQRNRAAGTVQSVTWTAIPGGGIPADQFGLFRLSVKLPDADSVSFPAAQTYADGTVVNWDQPPLPDGAEPDFPAPVLALSSAAGPVPPAERHTPSVTAASPPGAAEPPAARDNSARVLAGAALLVAALGVGIAVTRRRA